MELVIRNTANQPIYEQIYSQIRAQIIAGTLRPGDALPSIRALAKGCGLGREELTEMLCMFMEEQP